MSYAKIFPLGSLGSVVNTGVLQIQGGVYLDSTLRILTDQINTPSVLRLSTTSVTNYGGGAIPTNTAFGDQALLNNTTGANNLSLGYRALRANTSGSYNVGVGVDALLSNSTGIQNVAVGGLALSSNVSGTGNTALGYAALGNSQVSNNTALGNCALQNVVSGSANVAVGTNSLQSNTASNNTAVGFEAALTNTSGTGITAVGYQALRASTGGQNTSLGFQAGLANTTATENTFIGSSSGTQITTGGSNTFIGYRSGSGTGGGNIRNTIVGHEACFTGAVGSDNSVLGQIANSGGFSGSVILGRGATATANNQAVFGSSTTNAGAVTAETNTTISSWAVKINGTDRKLLLLDTAQNVIDVKQSVAASTSTTTVNWANGNLADITLTSSTTLTLSAPVIGTYIVKLTQGGAGSFTVTWPATVKWSGGIAPVLTTTAGKIDMITLLWDGTSYYGSYALNF